jgi:hypothetical protein
MAQYLHVRYAASSEKQIRMCGNTGSELRKRKALNDILYVTIAWAEREQLVTSSAS